MEKTRDCLSKLRGLTADADNVDAVLNAGLLKPCISSIVESDTTDELRELALENLANLSRSRAGIDAIKSHSNSISEIEKLTNSYSADIRTLANKVLSNLNSGGQAATHKGKENTGRDDNSKSNASRKKPKAVTISMKGLLGDREADKAYTQALLMVYGVLSVTVDPKNERVIIYTNRSDEIRHKLVESIEDVKKRYGGNKQVDRQPLGDLSASYLDDEEEDDFLGEGTVTERTCETIEQRIARKRREANKGNNRVRKRDMLYGAVTSLFGW
eukprot:gb/GECG01001782.1/.p1 GENE.gb/GECG01001782.1/~~gb/GECG01001782.1/.p1  ORF type:complete len:272 (+),score=34.76 gb/GECG01001782.1/:1-816(+)